MRHFTVALFGKEFLSFIWGPCGDGDQFVSNLGGDFSLSEEEPLDDDVEIHKPKIGFW